MATAAHSAREAVHIGDTVSTVAVLVATGGPDEAAEVDELVELIERTSLHAPSKRTPLSTRHRKRKGESSSSAAPASDIGPGWNSTIHRNRPRGLRGIVPSTDEPWKRCEELNYGRDLHIEWRTNHQALYRSGMVPDDIDKGIEQLASKKSEQLGNRLLTLEAKREASKRRAELAAMRAAERAEMEARAAALEELRLKVQAKLVEEARAADAAIEEELERERRRQAEAAAKAAAAAAAEAKRLAEEAAAAAKAAVAEAEARRKEEEQAELVEKQQRVTLGKAAALDKTTVKAKAPAATPMKGEGGAARKSSNKLGGKAR